MAKHIETCSICRKNKNEVNRLIKADNLYICDECISALYDICFSDGDGEDIYDGLNSTPSMIKAHLDKFVIGQEQAKIALSVAVYNHYKRLKNNFDINKDVEIQKSNVLLLGSTGSGKTYLAQSLAKYLGVPFTIADATSLSATGYVGDDVENILLRLIQAANYDIEAAECGIVYIDEVDKLARKGGNPSITRDVGGEGVQQALLKIIEGTVANVPLNGGRKHPHGDNVQIDTTNILFICGGAFDGIEKIIDEGNNHSIGFGASIKDTEKNTITDVQASDIVKYGLIPELVGRLPVITTLQPLCKEDFVRILTEPKNAILKQYQALLQADGLQLKFTDEALSEIADIALKRNTGARGLRSIIEKTMQPIMFNAPDYGGKGTVTITREVITDNAEAEICRDGAVKSKIA